MYPLVPYESSLDLVTSLSKTRKNAATRAVGPWRYSAGGASTLGGMDPKTDASCVEKFIYTPGSFSEVSWVDQGSRMVSIC